MCNYVSNKVAELLKHLIFVVHSVHSTPENMDFMFTLLV